MAHHKDENPSERNDRINPVKVKKSCGMRINLDAFKPVRTVGKDNIDLLNRRGSKKEVKESQYYPYLKDVGVNVKSVKRCYVYDLMLDVKKGIVDRSELYELLDNVINTVIKSSIEVNKRSIERKIKELERELESSLKLYEFRKLLTGKDQSVNVEKVKKNYEERKNILLNSVNIDVNSVNKLKFLYAVYEYVNGETESLFSLLGEKPEKVSIKDLISIKDKYVKYLYENLGNVINLDNKNFFKVFNEYLVKEIFVRDDRTLSLWSVQVQSIIQFLSDFNSNKDKLYASINEAINGRNYKDIYNFLNKLVNNPVENIEKELKKYNKNYVKREVSILNAKIKSYDSNGDLIAVIDGEEYVVGSEEYMYKLKSIAVEKMNKIVKELTEKKVKLYNEYNEFVIDKDNKYVELKKALNEIIEYVLVSIDNDLRSLHVKDVRLDNLIFVEDELITVKEMIESWDVNGIEYTRFCIENGYFNVLYSVMFILNSISANSIKNLFNNIYYLENEINEFNKYVNKTYEELKESYIDKIDKMCDNLNMYFNFHKLGIVEDKRNEVLYLVRVLNKNSDPEILSTISDSLFIYKGYYKYITLLKNVVDEKLCKIYEEKYKRVKSDLSKSYVDEFLRNYADELYCKYLFVKYLYDNKDKKYDLKNVYSLIGVINVNNSSIYNISMIKTLNDECHEIVRQYTLFKFILDNNLIDEKDEMYEIVKEKYKMYGKYISEIDAVIKESGYGYFKVRKRIVMDFHRNSNTLLELDYVYFRDIKEKYRNIINMLESATNNSNEEAYWEEYKDSLGSINMYDIVFEKEVKNIVEKFNLVFDGVNDNTRENFVDWIKCSYIDFCINKESYNSLIEEIVELINSDILKVKDNNIKN